MMEELEKLKHPIGQHEKPALITQELMQSFIQKIAAFPENLKKAVIHLSDEQLDTPYRPDGWTIRQVVHHCADSHMNALCRFKLALTEDNPVIKPYHEEIWAELADSKTLEIAPSLILLEGLHQRWVKLLSSLSAAELQRSFIHPSHGNKVFLDENTSIYAWHGEHHLAQITELKKRKNWN